MAFSTCYIKFASLLLCNIKYVIVKIVTPCFHRPSLLTYQVPGGITAYCTGNTRSRAFSIVNTSYATITGT